MSLRYLRLFRPVLPVLCISVAALSAPPAVFANTTPPPPASTVPQLPTVPLVPSDKPMRIGVGRSQTTAEVKASGGMYVVGEGAIHWETPPGQIVKLNLLVGKIQVEGLAKTFTGPVRLVARPAAQGQPPNYVSYKGRTYRGEIEVLISPKDQKLSVVNVANLEEYLLGVVGKEMTPTWPLEALKAQAVAARTFALRNLTKFADEGFNLDDTTNSQAYYGVTGEHPNSTRAVVSTKGQVLTYNGLLVATYYSSSSGGHTEGNDVIWGGALLPYLAGRPDFDNLPGNLRYAWRYSYTMDELLKALKAKGQDVGSVREVKSSEKVGSSGRPVQWFVVGSTRTATFTAEKFRQLLDLPSSPKVGALTGGTITTGIRTYNPQESMTVVSSDGTARSVPVGSVYVIGGSKTPTKPADTVVARGAAIGQVQMPATLEVTGGGYGHAVGMTQWGAHGLALLGRTFDQILTHYYQGTKVETR